MPAIKPMRRRESWNSRIAWFLCFCLLIVLAVQTVRVHLFPDERVTGQSKSQYWAQIQISMSRGDIRDRNGVPLAISVPSMSFYIDPAYWAPASADALEPLFGKEASAKFSKKLPGRFHWVARKVPMNVASQITDLKIPGLFTMRESSRMYPHGELASHVIGFCDIDGDGLSGLEREWNDVLYSPPQNRLFVRDARGNLLDMIGSNAGALQSGGGSIQLTIDSKVQQIVEWKLSEGVKASKAKWGAGICVNPQTGEILAMASYPWIDLSDRKSFGDKETLRNNVIGRVYEPGSTFKPIILGISKEMGLVSNDDHFFCSGKVTISDGVIRDVSSHGDLTLEGLLIKSCNTGMATIGHRMNPHDTSAMLRQFGFGAKSDVEIAGEEDGLLQAPEKWLGVTKANVAIGQGLAVTPLQLAMAIGAIANGGELLKPYIVSEVRNAGGEIVHHGKKRVKRVVLSSQTAAWLRGALHATVENGTGKGARVNDIAIAGKTGTAQMAMRGKYKKGQYDSSFIGFWPYEKPEYLLLIVLGDQGFYGGEVATPVFKAIVEDMSQLSLLAAQNDASAAIAR